MYRISVSNEEIEKLPLGTFPGKIVIIDKPGLKLNAAVAHLKAQKIIGFDTETRPVFNPTQPRHKVALLQLSTKSYAFLFRINKLGGIPKKVIDVLADPKILKIGAATTDDVRGLEKHLRFSPGGFVDLQKMVCQYGINDKSVRKMAAIILDIRISKTQQLSNWEADIFTEAQKKYAATDAWVCREMYLKLLDSPKSPLTPAQLAQIAQAQADAVSAKKAKAAAAENQPKGGESAVENTAAAELSPEEAAARKAARLKKRREAEKARRKRVRARKAAERAADAAPESQPVPESPSAPAEQPSTPQE